MSFPLPRQLGHGCVGPIGNSRQPVAPQVAHGAPRSALEKSTCAVTNLTLYTLVLRLIALGRGVYRYSYHFDSEIVLRANVFNNYEFETYIHFTRQRIAKLFKTHIPVLG